MSEVPIEGKVVGQIGEATYYEVQEPSIDTGSDWDTPIKAEPFYRRMAYVSGRGYGKTQAQREMAAQMQVYGWGNLESRYLANVLGNWQETPREELQRRLNNWLQGTYPGEPINWKGLK